MIRIMCKGKYRFVMYTRASGALEIDKEHDFTAQPNVITDAPDWIRNDPHFQRGIVQGVIHELKSESDVKEAEAEAAVSRNIGQPRREKITGAAATK